MAEIDKTQQLKEQLEANRLEFVQTEIDLAHTFVQTAEMTRSRETARRNLDNAQKAHDAALAFLEGNPPLTKPQREALESTIARLKRQIDHVRSLHL